MSDRTGYFGKHFLSWVNGMVIGGLITNAVAFTGKLHTGPEQTAFYLFFTVVTAALMRWEKKREESDNG
jgi:hypothetical protein